MNYIYIALSLAMLPILNACRADALGDKEQVSYQIDATNPTWDNGVSALVINKCATCHTSSRDTFVPANVPHSIDSIGTLAFFDATDAKSVGLKMAVYNKVFLDTHYPMPTRFATALNDDEKAGFAAFLKSKGVTDTAICPTKSTTLTYATAAPAIDANCALSGCHALGSVNYPLNNFENVRRYRSKALGYLASVYMPLGSADDFAKNPDYATIRDWLCAGADLN